MANGGFGGGNGTLATPWLVEDALDLNAVRTKGAHYFRQVANIDMSINYPLSWVPIASLGQALNFTGSYDGAGYEIRNLKNSLFNVIVGSTRQLVAYNIKLIDISINVATAYVGGLVKQIYGTTFYPVPLIDNIVVTGSITVTGTFVGGIVGFMSMPGSTKTTRLQRLSNYATITCAGSYVGGILGGTPIGAIGSYPNAAISLTDCVNGGLVSGDSYVGGIVGVHGQYADTVQLMILSRCVNWGNIKAVNNGCGIIGYMTPQTQCQNNINSCYSLCNIVERVSGVSANSYRVTNRITSASNVPGLSTMVYRRNGSVDTTVFPPGGYNGSSNITVAAAMAQATYTGFTFSSTYWAIDQGTSYPYLVFGHVPPPPPPPPPPPTLVFGKIFKGTVPITRIYLGTQDITNVLLGNTVVG